VPDAQWFKTHAADKAEGTPLYGHKAGGKGSTTSSLDYKVPVGAHSCRRPSFLCCLCGWAQPSMCGSAGSALDLWGSWRLPAALLCSSFWQRCSLSPAPNTPKPVGKCSSGEIHEREARRPCRRSTRLQPLVGPHHKGRPDVPLTTGAQAELNQGPQPAHRGAGEQ